MFAFRANIYEKGSLFGGIESKQRTNLVDINPFNIQAFTEKHSFAFVKYIAYALGQLISILTISLCKNHN